MPHQEIYLAALDQQASTAFSTLARAAGHSDSADQAATRASRLGDTIEKEYFLPNSGFYAFSHNPDGTTDDTATIFPSVAWWDGTFHLTHTEPMFERWASSEFSTDWGTRILSDKTSFYDPISYHQGSVWPLFTGWVSLAEYRAHQPLAAYAHLMQNANLTWAQDPGSVTELLSGQFFQVLGRSTAHQLWSSAMVISPILRGIFGLEWNEPANTLTITPQLPAEWPGAQLHNVPFGSSRLNLSLERHGPTLEVQVQGAPPNLHLASRTPGTQIRGNTLFIPLPAVEAGAQQHLPTFGSETSQPKVLEQQYQPHALVLHLAAPAGTDFTMDVRENAAVKNLTADGATLHPGTSGLQQLRISFPSGHADSTQPYVEKTVTLRW